VEVIVSLPPQTIFDNLVANIYPSLLYNIQKKKAISLEYERIATVLKRFQVPENDFGNSTLFYITFLPYFSKGNVNNMVALYR
jgi:hypothetical protein